MLVLIIINLRLFLTSVLLLLRHVLANNSIHSEGQCSFCQVYIIYAGLDLWSNWVPSRLLTGRSLDANRNERCTVLI